MASIRVNGLRLYYEDTGTGAETMVFSHGLLWSTRQFDRQVAALHDRYRCIAYDHRGQGQSEVPRAAAIDVETLYQDAVALLEELGISKCHFAGLSMGGFVALRLALRRPELLRSLILMATSADPEPRSKVIPYWLFAQVARCGGLALITRQLVMPQLFGPTFLADPVRAGEREEWYRRLADNRPDIYRAVQGVIQRRGVYALIDRIAVPTLILVGEDDPATVPARAERMQARIAGSVLVRIPHAGHTLTVEAPEATNQALLAFLDHIHR